MERYARAELRPQLAPTLARRERVFVAAFCARVLALHLGAQARELVDSCERECDHAAELVRQARELRRRT